METREEKTVPGVKEFVMETILICHLHLVTLYYRLKITTFTAAF